jgi:hypothetical protein
VTRTREAAGWCNKAQAVFWGEIEGLTGECESHATAVSDREGAIVA